MQSQSRYNMYEVIHKALRARLAGTLVSIGQLDAHLDACVQELVAEVQTTLAMMRGDLAMPENATATRPPRGLSRGPARPAGSTRGTAAPRPPRA